MPQELIFPNGRYTEFEDWIVRNRCKNVMIVSGHSMMKKPHFNLYLEAIQRKGARFTPFHDFAPNPHYESVIDAVRLFREQHCDAIITVGGGSTIDVGKCVKLYSNMPGDGKDGSFLKQEIVENSIPFLAVPTTAGSGSEATRYAVVYYQGKKQSINSESCIPGTVLLDIAFLTTLPDYQRKSTMCDALCHTIESFWSVNSTEESKVCATEAIQSVLGDMEDYLKNTDKGNAGMLRAAHMAGKAINISQTTAGHAMCYMITSMFGSAHGHAAMLCNRVLYPWMTESIKNNGGCIDPRGQEYVRGTLDEIGKAMGCRDAESGAEKLNRIFENLELEVPVVSREQFERLKTSVNPVRLKNHPIALDEETIDMLYHRILIQE